MKHEATLQLIRERVAPLDPLSIELIDDSARHAGHAGAKEGGHFRLEIVASCFAGKSRLESQRMVLKEIGDLSSAGIHAISIVARSPQATSGSL
jgi:BolA protein